MIKFYLNGVELKNCQIIQNEVGRYYYDSVKKYWTTTLGKFDTATPPSPYKIYTNGSHKSYNGVSYLYQRSLDIRGNTDYALTASEPVNVTYSSYADGSYCKFTWGGKIFFAVHTYNWASKIVPTGGVICKIAPKSISKVDPHLHFWGSGFAVRDIILAEGQMNKGDKIEWIKDTNIRQGNGLSYPINATAKQGAVAVLRSSEVRKTDGYEWMDIEHPSVTGWAVKQNMKPTNKVVTNVDGSPVVVPPLVKTCEEKLAEEVNAHAQTHGRLDRANKEIIILTEQMENMKDVCKLEKQELQIKIDEQRIQLKTLADKNDELKKENKDIKEKNIELEKALEECKGGNTGCLPLVNLFKKPIDTLPE